MPPSVVVAHRFAVSLIVAVVQETYYDGTVLRKTEGRQRRWAGECAVFVAWTTAQGAAPRIDGKCPLSNLIAYQAQIKML